MICKNQVLQASHHSGHTPKVVLSVFTLSCLVTSKSLGSYGEPKDRASRNEGEATKCLFGQLRPKPYLRQSTQLHLRSNLSVKKVWDVIAFRVSPPPLSHFTGCFAGGGETLDTIMSSPMHLTIPRDMWGKVYVGSSDIVPCNVWFGPEPIAFSKAHTEHKWLDYMVFAISARNGSLTHHTQHWDKSTVGGGIDGHLHSIKGSIHCPKLLLLHTVEMSKLGMVMSFTDNAG